MADRSPSFTATKVCSSDTRAALRPFRNSRKGLCVQLPASCQVFDGQHLFDIKLVVRGFPAEHMVELHDVGSKESALEESLLSPHKQAEHPTLRQLGFQLQLKKTVAAKKNGCAALTNPTARKKNGCGLREEWYHESPT